jgi:hypothetical protein
MRKKILIRGTNTMKKKEQNFNIVEQQPTVEGKSIYWQSKSRLNLEQIFCRGTNHDYKKRNTKV